MKSNIWKKSLAVSLLAALSLTAMSGCGAASTESAEGQSRLDQILAEGKITMVTSPDFAPLEFEDISSGTTEYVGSDIELAKYIAEKLGVELEIEAMDFSAVQAAITTGKADIAIAGFAATPERQESMELSIPFNKENDDGQGLLVKADQAANYTTAESFAGKKVGAQNGSLQYNLVSSQLPDANVELVSSLNDGVLMLQTGKIDALAVSGDNGLMMADNYDDVVMCDFYFEYESEGNVVAMTKGETELAAAVNEILEEVNEKGLYEEWRKEAVELAESLGVEVNE